MFVSVLSGLIPVQQSKLQPNGSLLSFLINGVSCICGPVVRHASLTTTNPVPTINFVMILSGSFVPVTDTQRELGVQHGSSFSGRYHRYNSGRIAVNTFT